MKSLKSQLEWEGVMYEVEYFDDPDFSYLEKEKCTQTYAISFCGDKLVVVKNGKKDTWGPPGGTIEAGEEFAETLKREVVEEANMNILYFEPLGYQRVLNLTTGKEVYQLRYYAEVEKIGEFVSDPAGTIIEVRLIRPEDYGEYVKWGEKGDMIFQGAIGIYKNRNKG